MTRKNLGKNHRDNRLEFLTGGVAFVLGVWVLNPWTDILPHWGIYAFLLTIANETVWGLLICLFGGMQLFAALRGSKKARKGLSVIGMFLWILLGLSHILSSVVSTGWIAYMLYAIMNFLIYIHTERA
jgi:hypothetical protein